MSDDVLSVTSQFADVATLAQGYMNRADGERLLLPLAQPIGEGQGVRFVVYLGDGTPAFAGAGRCLQVSDQGEGVPPEVRFETLIDALQFDERSQPVYDYIVAVRSAAYAAAAEEAEGVPVETPADEGYPDDAVDVADVDDAELSDTGGYDDEPTRFLGPASTRAADVALESESAEEPAAYAEDGGEYVPEVPDAVYDVAVEPSEPPAYAEDGGEYEPEAPAYAEAAADVADAQLEPAIEEVPYAEESAAYAEAPVAYAEEPAVYAEEPAVYAEEPAVYADESAAHPGAPAAYAAEGDVYEPPLPSELPGSLPPEAIPTGMLTRPALGMHWAPAVPRRPTPRPSTGLFQYNGSGLPTPARPPRPELDPAYWVAPAPRPGAHAAAAAVAAAGGSEVAAYASEEAFEVEDAAPTYAQEALDDAHDVADAGMEASEPSTAEDDAVADDTDEDDAAYPGFGTPSDPAPDPTDGGGEDDIEIDGDDFEDDR